MINQVSQPRLKGLRFPRPNISYAVWAYHRFALSLRNVGDLLAERGVIVSYESIRVWCQRFGMQIATSSCRQMAPRRGRDFNSRAKTLALTSGRRQRRRTGNPDAKPQKCPCCKRFLMKLIKRWGVPRVLVTDKLRSYGDLCPSVDPRSHKGLNNRSEASH